MLKVTEMFNEEFENISSSGVYYGKTSEINQEIPVNTKDALYRATQLFGPDLEHFGLEGWSMLLRHEDGAIIRLSEKMYEPSESHRYPHEERNCVMEILEQGDGPEISTMMACLRGLLSKEVITYGQEEDCDEEW